MAMKTREQIYRQEAASLLRDISTYHCIMGKQWKRLYPGKEDKIDRLLEYLVKQGRMFYYEYKDTYFLTRETEPDREMLSALWVLSDFGDKCEYHSTDAYPSKIVFFADGETYEIVYVPADKIGLIMHAMKARKDDDCGKKILIVEDASLIDEIELENAIFCTVDMETGEVEYYKKE